MKNRIEIEFNHGIFKAFWKYGHPTNRKNDAEYIQHCDRLIFIANTKEQAEQRAKEFIESHDGIKGFVFL